VKEVVYHYPLVLTVRLVCCDDAEKKVVKEDRMKSYWGVFSQAMKKLVTFEYADKRAAEKKAADLGPNHFVQLIKEPIADA
jgi:hypothetical protein